MKLRNCSIITVILVAIAFASMQSAQAQFDHLPFGKSKTDVKPWN